MQNIRQQCETLFWQAVDTVLPPRCVASGEMVEQQGMIAPKIWADLDFIVNPMCVSCGFPFDFEVDTGSLCTYCLERPPPFETARSALKYNDAIRRIILGFKHADKTYMAKAFAPWLKRAGAEMLEIADLLVPVPLHPWRLVKRRYNQSALIAEILGQEIGKSVLVDGLERVRATPSQGYLGTKERFQNVRRAFAVNPRRVVEIKDKNIVLVDDVLTTGATAQECTKALMKAGANRVDVLTVARVVRARFS